MGTTMITTRMRTETARSFSRRVDETDEAEVIALLDEMAAQTRAELNEQMSRLRAALADNLAQFFQPSLTADERSVADLEGWILGVR